MPFFIGLKFSDPNAWKMCFFASISDAVIVVSILAIGRLFFGRFNWPDKLNTARVLFLGISGALIAICIEVLALKSGKWAYSHLMLMLPIINVGVLPILQMMLLPYLSYRIGIRLSEALKINRS